MYKRQAELVAKEIYSIRESKNALLRGEADNMPKDGAQLDVYKRQSLFSTSFPALYTDGY